MAEQSTFENELPKKSTVEYVRGLDANGNPILINKSDLASVVGGLIGVVTKNKDGLYDKDWMIPRGTLRTSSEFEPDYVVTSDEELQSLPLGIYAFYSPNGLIPITVSGVLIIGSGRGGSNTSSSFMVFMRDNTFLYRMKWDTWSKWYKVTTAIA